MYQPPVFTQSVCDNELLDDTAAWEEEIIEAVNEWQWVERFQKNWMIEFVSRQEDKNYLNLN